MALFKKIDTPLGQYPVVFLLTVVLISVYLLTSIVTYIHLYVTRYRFKKRNGVGSISLEPSKNPFGFDIVVKSFKNAKNNSTLQYQSHLFESLNTRTFATKLLGRYDITTSDFENMKAVLATQFEDFGLFRRKKTLAPLLGDGIFTSDGQEWQHSRAMIRPNFIKSQVADLAMFERHMQTFLQVLPTDGQTVDLGGIFFKYSIDSATSFLMGNSVGTLESTLKNEKSPIMEFAAAFPRAQQYCVALGRVGNFTMLYRDKDGENAIAFCHSFVDEFVRQALEHQNNVEAGLIESKRENSDSYIFLNELAKLTQDPKRLRDEVLNMLLASTDTIASLLTNLWFMLAKNPEIYAKLRHEVIEAFGNETPKYEELRNLKYLRYCLNESLRLHPPVPNSGRTAFKDTTLPTGGGPDGRQPVFVPKGCTVTLSRWALHRRTDLFGPDAATAFRPERWETVRPSWEFQAFSGGPRICVGQQYAYTEAGYVTARLCQAVVRLEDRDGRPFVEGLSFTLASLNGVKVGLTRA